MLRPTVIWRVLAATTSLLSALLFSTTAAAATPFTVGTEETIVTAQQRHTKPGLLPPTGKACWPDGKFGILKTGANEWTFFAANSDCSRKAYVAKTVGTLDNPLAGTANGGITILNPPAGLAYLGGGPVYDAGIQQDGNRLLLMFTHAERYQGDDIDSFYASLRLAKSTDGGTTWQYLGEILRPNRDFEDIDTAPNAFGAHGSFVIINPPDDPLSSYFYVYDTDLLMSPPESPVYNQVYVARAKVADVVAAANSGTVTVWKKYYKGGWTENGIGGRSTELQTFGFEFWHWVGASKNDNGTPTILDDKYLLVVEGPDTDQVDGNDTGDEVDTDLYLTESTDGLNWSRATLVANGFGDYYYNNIVGTGANPYISGTSFYLYSAVSPGFNCLGPLYETDPFTGRYCRAMAASPVLVRRAIQFNVSGAAPSVPGGLTATAGTVPLLTWAESTGPGNCPISYTVQVDQTDDNFSSPVVDASWIGPNQYKIQNELAGSTNYNWRVRATNSCGGDSPWSTVASLTTPLTSSTTYKASSNYSTTTNPDNPTGTSWGFQYASIDGLTLTRMPVYNPTEQAWNGPQGDQYSLVGPDWQHPGASNDSARTWGANQAGRVTISGRVFAAGGQGDGIVVSIWQNNDRIWWQMLAPADTVGFHVNLGRNVAATDKIRFRVSKFGDNDYDTIYWDPEIVFTPISSGPTVYELWKDYGSTQGQGQWSYESATGNTYTPIALYDRPMRWWSTQQAPWVLLGRDVTNGDKRTWANPGDLNDDAVYTWTAPAAGTVTVSGEARMQDKPQTDGVLLTIRKNNIVQGATIEILPTDLNGDEVPDQVPFTRANIPVVLGDKIHLRLNQRGHNLNDSTVFEGIREGNSAGSTKVVFTPS